MRKGAKFAAVVFLVLAVAAPAGAWHWSSYGWNHQHYNYPPKPSGYTAIVRTFGTPCSSDARYNWMEWQAADNGYWYQLRHHRRLGGSSSTNLWYDVRGHVGDAHLDPYVKSGIWTYSCRYVAGTSKYSTHAWGIAIDQNARYEHVRHYHTHTVARGVSDTFQGHGWTWGISFGDAMHFQYASGY